MPITYHSTPSLNIKIYKKLTACINVYSKYIFCVDSICSLSALKWTLNCKLQRSHGRIILSLSFRSSRNWHLNQVSITKIASTRMIFTNSWLLNSEVSLQQLHKFCFAFHYSPKNAPSIVWTFEENCVDISFSFLPSFLNLSLVEWTKRNYLRYVSCFFNSPKSVRNSMHTALGGHGTQPFQLLYDRNYYWSVRAFQVN